MGYDVHSIYEMSEREHLRKNPGMFIGHTENPTRLLDEVLDNSLDEMQFSKECNRIVVNIDTKGKFFTVLDNGRGIPFDENLSIDKDPPVISCTKLRTSGKFDKGKDGAAYHIAAGLHGVGITAVNFLSDKMIIEIYRDKKYAKYTFDYNGKVEREITDNNFEEKNRPFGTKVTVFPSKKHFKSIQIDAKHIEERLKIAVACSKREDFKAALIINQDKKIITSTEEDILEENLGKDLNNWLSFEDQKNKDKYQIKFTWDKDHNSTVFKFLGVINLIKVQEGSHLVKLTKILKTVFSDFAKKYKYEIEPEDCLRWLRSYIKLDLCNTSFDAQIKVRLGKDTNLDIMDSLENNIKDYFKKNEDRLKEILEQAQDYRKSVSNKKVLRKSTGKRVSSSFTKLKDCTDYNGELLIGEGDSAVGGIIRVRDIRKHAILPLRGVIANAATKKNLLENVEVKEILQALGCGIDKSFDISKLRYDKIILAADADPAGKFITVLLIGLFINLTPDLIKQGKIYICETPLYGYGRGKDFVPIWSENDLQNRIKEGKNFRRFKGLGEFNPEELKRFTLDKDTRRLIQVEWGEHIEDLISLYTESEEKRNLMLKLGKWKD